MEQFILFGDSITQQSGSQAQGGFAFAPALQDAYIRRLDVVNRGLSGYNTAQALKVLPRVLPPPAHNRVRLMTIFFGANDACLPNTPGFAQNVPLQQFKDNVVKLATHELVAAHNPTIILVTPPPVDEHLCLQKDRTVGINVIRRTAENTARYAEAVREVGKTLGLPVLDLWTAFMKEAGWQQGDPLPGSSDVPQNEVLTRLMHDGLHLNPEGYKILYDKLVELIEKQLPDQVPEKLPFVLPSWDDADAWQV
ncbi:isoamyl acetate-hydrolyzing esterase [Delphinella strobiligena]|nr:isoamyl acetate-hydrolyzing esterase [Delphinella strobiligena]